MLLEPDTLDDSWFDRPGHSLRREDLPTLPPPPVREEVPAQRDNSIELDDPWFREDSWR